MSRKTHILLKYFYKTDFLDIDGCIHAAYIHKVFRICLHKRPLNNEILISREVLNAKFPIAIVLKIETTNSERRILKLYSIVHRSEGCLRRVSTYGLLGDSQKCFKTRNFDRFS